MTNLNDKLDSILNNVISSSSNTNPFNTLEAKIKDEYTYGASSLAEMRARENRKTRGDLFELFAQRYFRHLYHPNGIVMENVWLLKELPEDEKVKLNLRSNDMGIDLVAKDTKNNYYAIQVKFRTPNKYKEKTYLEWTKLSTFYAMVSTTGPKKGWTRNIVFTNADGCRYGSRRREKGIDISVCRGTLENLTHMDFVTLSGKSEDIKLDDSSSSSEEEIKIKPKPTSRPKTRTTKKKLIYGKNSKVDLHELREKRLLYFDNLPTETKHDEHTDS